MLRTQGLPSKRGKSRSIPSCRQFEPERAGLIENQERWLNVTTGLQRSWHAISNPNSLMGIDLHWQPHGSVTNASRLERQRYSSFSLLKTCRRCKKYGGVASRRTLLGVNMCNAPPQILKLAVSNVRVIGGADNESCRAAIRKFYDWIGLPELVPM